MTELGGAHDRAKIATLKVLYLFVITAAVFALPAVIAGRMQWLAITGLLAVQILALLACRIDFSDIARPILRLKWLFAFLIAAYTFLPGENGASGPSIVAWQIPLIGWKLPVSLGGLEQAGRMCLQISTILLASSLVRLTGTGRDFVEGLERFHLPPLFVHSLDRTLGLLGGGRKRSNGGGRARAEGAGTGGGRDGRRSQDGFLPILTRLLRGDVSAFVQSIRRDVDRAGEQIGSQTGPQLSTQLTHDVAIVSGIALSMATLKMFRILPGVPFASGHKALLLFPLYILAARFTYSRWGATAAGAVMGVIGFLQGDGRFGILELLKHLAPGIVIDRTLPLVNRLPRWVFGYCLLGLGAAVARTTTEFVLVAMLGARAEIYIFPMAKLVPNLIAGFLSGFATLFVLRAFERSVGRQHQASDADESAGAASGQRGDTRAEQTADVASRVP